MHMKMFLPLIHLFLLPLLSFAETPAIRIAQVDADPYGFPRPAPNQTNVPLRTSFFFQLGIDKGAPDDKVDLDSLSVELQREGEQSVHILSAGKKFSPGYRGEVSTKASGGGWGLKPSMSAWIDSDKTLEPLTTYTLRVSARSRNGAELSEEDGTWSFATEEAPRIHNLSYQLNLANSPRVEWKQGGFFTGQCNVGGNAEWIPGYEIMDAARKDAPRAWSLHRAESISGTERQPNWFWTKTLPNVERDLETRRITAMEKTDDGALLRLEDFFGHEQYDILSDRPLSEDYKPGYEVLIADGVISTRTLVVSVNDSDRSILVKPFLPDASGWKIAYSGKLPEKEDPAAPGLFAPGGCYLQRYAPAGTPKYYWGRLDTEFDLIHRRFGHRLVANFIEIAGDLGNTGKGEYVAKDWVQYHSAVRDITAHIVERYGEPCLDWYWSIFNEPDLLSAEWRSPEGWNALQVFYDYSVDAILRAFEDKGYDSSRVIIGGIELGGIAGTNVRVAEFLGHCSPTGIAKGALPLNAAFADRRLDGKRSKRVEDLCRPHGGKGAPMDFLSIHAYNRSEMMVGKLLRAKDIALEIDPAYYEKLIVTSYETVPGWSPPPDPAARDSFLGNGYFSTWCADVTWRLLQKAANDPRYAYGEATITRWTGPISNFSGLNEVIQMLMVDDNDDRKLDRKIPIPMPVFHSLNLINSMDSNYYLLPEQQVGAHRVAGFVTRTDKDTRILLYAHNMPDVQSRSDAEFDVALDLSDINWPRVKMTSYQIDKERNTCFKVARAVADRFDAEPASYGQSRLVKGDEARKAERLSALRPTQEKSGLQPESNKLRLRLPLSANGVNFVILSPEQ